MYPVITENLALGSDGRISFPNETADLVPFFIHFDVMDHFSGVVPISRIVGSSPTMIKTIILFQLCWNRIFTTCHSRPDRESI